MLELTKEFLQDDHSIKLFTSEIMFISYIYKIEIVFVI